MTTAVSPLRRGVENSAAPWGASPWAVGAGTAWEGRGDLGVGRAFVRTLTSGIVSPAYLLAGMRRPDGRDTVGLVLLYGLFWGASVLVHAALLLVRYRRQGDLQVIENEYWQAAGLLAAGVVVAAVPGFALVVRTFARLVRYDMPHPASPAMF